jgi:hypothetical protein
MHHLVIVFPLPIRGIYWCVYIFIILLIVAIFIENIHSSKLYWLKTILIPRPIRNAIMLLDYFLWSDIVHHSILELICVQD